MRGDFTRRPFRRDLHNAGVLHQQGRVWLDGDWNEDVFHRLDLLQQETIDIVGRCGVPDDPTSTADDDFFLVEADPALGTGDFRIHAGRAYVDGILALLDADTTYRTQPDNPDPEPIALPSQGSAQGIVYLEVWQRLVTYLEDPSIRERALEGPDTATRLRTIAQIKTLSVPGNRARRLTCETAREFLPQPGSGVLSTDQPATSEPEDPCRLPDDALYTGRENRLYRVEIHDAGDVEGVPRPTGPATQFSLAITADSAPGAVSLPLASAPTSEQVAALLRTGVVRIRDDDGLAETLPIVGVTGATITLARPLKSAYTVAKHATATGGVARFKWSRDNAAFATRITGVDATRTVLTVELLGRDQVTALKAGDLVEVADDASELGPGRGHLTYLTTDPHPDLFTVTLADPLPPSFDLTKQEERHLLLRRWDGVGWAARDFDEPDMDLGDGVRIRFDKHDLRSGDWWTIATRRVDGSVEQRVAAEPDGTARHYCVLALARWTQAAGLPLSRILALANAAGFNPEQRAKLNNGLQPPGATTYPKNAAKKAADTSGAPAAAITRFKAAVDADPLMAMEVSDCRERFPPLTHLPSYHALRHVGGDGQQGAAGETLSCPLVVGVEDEHGQPVQGVKVRFETTPGTGDGLQVVSSDPLTPTVDVTTAHHGMAATLWQLGQETGCHRVIARLLDPPPQTTSLPIFFEATLREPGPEPREFPHVVKISWRNDRPLELADFNRGLAVTFDKQMAPQTAGLDTFIVTIETSEIADQDVRFPGHRPLIIFGGVEVRDDGRIWIFKPCPPLPPNVLTEWMNRERLIHQVSIRARCRRGTTENKQPPAIRVRVTLKSNVILDIETSTPLDGDVFGKIIEDPPGVVVTDLTLPSGDGVPGGDFESWFYLSEPKQTVATPVIEPPSGGSTIDVAVTITDATPGATIFFTTDGTEPTRASQTYAGTFTVPWRDPQHPTTVKAKGVLTSFNDSTVASVTYDWVRIG